MRDIIEIYNDKMHFRKEQMMSEFVTLEGVKKIYRMGGGGRN